MQSSPQYSPTQILDAGRRAEADGRRDQAVQLYQYLYDHFGRTEEGRAAHDALVRLNNARSTLNGTGSHDRAAQHAQAGVHQQSTSLRGGAAGTLVHPMQDNYRLGRFVARFLGFMGWLTFASGLIILLFGVASIFVPRLGALMYGFGLYGVGVGIFGIFGGLMLVALAQFARAVYDTANATRDLAYLRRLELGAPTGE